MSFFISIQHDTVGATLTATIQRMVGTAYWNPTNENFNDTVFVYANHKMALTEGPSDRQKSYTLTETGMGSPGQCLVRIHDEGDSNRVTQAFHVWIYDSVEWAGPDMQRDVSDVASVSVNANPLEMIRMIWATMYLKNDHTGSQWRTYNSSDVVNVTRTTTDSGGVQTIERAT